MIGHHLTDKAAFQGIAQRPRFSSAPRTGAEAKSTLVQAGAPSPFMTGTSPYKAPSASGGAPFFVQDREVYDDEAGMSGEIMDTGEILWDLDEQEAN